MSVKYLTKAKTNIASMFVSMSSRPKIKPMANWSPINTLVIKKSLVLSLSESFHARPKDSKALLFWNIMYAGYIPSLANK